MKRHPVHTLLCLTPLALTLASCEKVEVIDEAPADGETTTVRILARAATPATTRSRSSTRRTSYVRAPRRNGRAMASNAAAAAPVSNSVS